ncbi:6144_t:CDS:1, partial [Dentiscutata heterogama]
SLISNGSISDNDSRRRTVSCKMSSRLVLERNPEPTFLNHLNLHKHITK